MKKYLDLAAYPIAVLTCYILMAFANWDRDPGTWDWKARALWIIWALAWGWALSLRIRINKEST